MPFKCILRTSWQHTKSLLYLYTQIHLQSFLSKEIQMNRNN